MEAIESVGASVAYQVAKPLVEQVLDHFRYMFCFDKFVEDLQKQERYFEAIDAKVEHKVKAAERNVEVIMEVVKKWLEEVDAIMKKLQHFKTTIGQHERQCLSKCFPNLLWQYQQSKEAANLTEVLKELGERGNNFGDSVSSPAPHPNIEFLVSEFVMSKSAEAAMEEVMAALKDDGVNMIGLYGMGGVGKTTLVKEIAKKVEELKLFNKVVMVVVSQNPSIQKMQDQLAYKLDLSFAEVTGGRGRVDKLYLRLKDLGKVLIIFDDVWKELRLQDIGIPFEKEHGCKILLTTRRLHICSVMKCQKEVQLDVHNEDEGWTLFKKSAGLSDDSPLNLVARNVAGECRGLAIAIVAVGKALINKPEDDWVVAYEELRKSRLLAIEDVDVDVNACKCLKFSYDYLKNLETKFCFLLCSLFPEDYEISMEDIARYAIGLGLYDDVDSIEDARKRVNVAVGHLKDCCLLLKAGRKQKVKMHDVVRDVAKWIGTKIEKLFIEISEAELEGMLRIENFGNIVATSSLDNDPKALLEKIEILALSGKGPSREASISEEIKDLSLAHGCLSLESFENLKTLQTLELNFLGLHIITSSLASLGKLNRLKILRFRDSSIRELPEELGELSNLRLLDLTFCKKLETIPPNMFKRLFKLEELYIGVSSFKNWEIEGEGRSRSNASLMELSSLSHLAILWLKVEDKRIPENFVFSSSLKLFSLHINCQWGCGFDTSYPGSYPRSRKICFSPTNVAMNACKELLQNARIINCDHDRQRVNMHTIFPLKLLENLEGIKVRMCNGVQELFQLDGFDIAANEDKVLLSHLTKIYLHSLPELRCILKGPTRRVNLESLKYFTLNKCGNLKSLFSPSLARSLVHLEDISISNCDQLEQIIKEEEEEGDVTSSKTHSASLSSLQNLRTLTIYGCDRLEYVIPVSFASHLLHLKGIKISGCPELKRIFGNGRGEVVVAGDGNEKMHHHRHHHPQEEITQLECSSKIGYFYYLGDSVVVLPSLEQININDCPKLCAYSIAKITEPSQSQANSKAVRVKESEESQLQRLTLVECNELDHIITKDDDNKNYQNGMRRPMHSVYFRHLDYIDIYSCNKLMTIFPFTIARGIPLLRYLCVEKCDQLVEVLALGDDGGADINHNNDQITMPKLEILILRWLPSLISFCPADYYCIFPSLTRLEVAECPKMLTSFIIQPNSPIQTKTQANSTIVRVKEGEESQLQKLTLVECNGLDHIITKDDDNKNYQNGMRSPMHSVYFRHLVYIQISSCNKLKTIFPFTIAQGIPLLRSFGVEKCDQLVEVLASGDDGGADINHNNDQITMPKLKELILRCLPSLISFCPADYCCIFPSLTCLEVAECPKMLTSFIIQPNSPIQTKTQANSKNLRVKDGEESKLQRLILDECNEIDHIITKDDVDKNYQNELRSPMHSVCFRYLDYISISNCNKLMTIFPFTIARGIPLLSYFCVEKCDQLVEVLALGDDGGADINHNNDQIIMPKLESLILQSLPSLISFCPAGYQCMFPSLTLLKVGKCPKAMTSFIIRSNNSVEAKTQELNEAATSTSALASTSTQPTILPLSTNKCIICKLEEEEIEEEEEEEEEIEEEEEEEEIEEVLPLSTNQRLIWAFHEDEEEEDDEEEEEEEDDEEEEDEEEEENY